MTTARCGLCRESLTGDGHATVLIDDHLRLMHPDRYAEIGPARWPDGGMVVIDSTIQPDEFTGGPST